jgi:hypothetical protein
VCLSSEAGEVCAEGGDGQVQFSADGLEAGSEVRIESDEFGSVVYTVGADGSLADAGAQGLMSFVAGTEFSFAVTATDAQGEPILGNITVSA